LAPVDLGNPDDLIHGPLTGDSTRGHRCLRRDRERCLADTMVLIASQGRRLSAVRGMDLLSQVSRTRG
jgi:hypothetical protein